MPSRGCPERASWRDGAVGRSSSRASRGRLPLGLHWIELSVLSTLSRNCGCPCRCTMACSVHFLASSELVESNVERALLPYQGLHQAIPAPPLGTMVDGASGAIHAVPVLGGLHHKYQRAA